MGFRESKYRFGTQKVALIMVYLCLVHSLTVRLGAGRHEYEGVPIEYDFMVSSLRGIRTR
jgi:hypothetical protein